jgi:integrase
MARPPLPLGSHGKIKTWAEGTRYIARTKFRDLDGVVRPVKRSGKTGPAAERALRAALVERQAPMKNAEIASGSTFGKAAELWLLEVEQAVEAGQRSSGTLANYQSVYGVHVRPALASLRLREVTTPVVDRFLSALSRKTVSQAQVAKVIVSGVMRYAARHGAIQINPVREVGSIAGPVRQPARSLDAGERQQWLKALEGIDRAKVWDLPDLTRMMRATGCRIGECLAIG